MKERQNKTDKRVHGETRCQTHTRGGATRGVRELLRGTETGESFQAASFARISLGGEEQEKGTFKEQGVFHILLDPDMHLCKLHNYRTHT